MIRLSYDLEIITPCFCAGADPTQAEIRAPSIRGQLRWWFRALGGFKSLASSKNLREQEAMIFGSAADGAETGAGALQVRVQAPDQASLTDSEAFREPDMQTAEGYLLFPLRQKIRERTGLRSFRLHLQCRSSNLPKRDIEALATVFGHLGSLGFRSRRAMGALRLAAGSLPLNEALSVFNDGELLAIRSLCHQSEGMKKIIADANGQIANENRFRQRNGKPPLPALQLTTLDDPKKVAQLLALWLRAWRAYGKSPHQLSPHRTDKSLRHDLIKKDHDAGRGSPGPVYRAALGLPMIQKFSSPPPQTVTWNESFDTAKAARDTRYQGEGRFASPILLRPHKDGMGHWTALVIFLSPKMTWPSAKPAHINRSPRTVSLDLYNAMKADSRLTPFPSPGTPPHNPQTCPSSR
jgi:CRISPR-associated protein Cmr1